MIAEEFAPRSQLVFEKKMGYIWREEGERKFHISLPVGLKLKEE